jgi:hypothetical protein
MRRASCFVLVFGVGVASRLPAQTSMQRVRVEEGPNIAAETRREPESVERVRSPSEAREYDAARRLADSARGFRIVISLDDRALWVLRNNDTLRTARVGIASGMTLAYGGRQWTFRTPRGRRTVLGSRVAPLWTPPDWAYAEIASQHKLRLAWLAPGKPVTLRDGRRLTVRADAVGLLERDGAFRPLPADEHIIFQSTLYVPPYGTRNRQIKGELGPYALDLGSGYLLHGGAGPPGDSLGLAPTHGCIRLTDDDLEWLYRRVEKGTPVYIY